MKAFVIFFKCVIIYLVASSCLYIQIVAHNTSDDLTITANVFVVFSLAPWGESSIINPKTFVFLEFFKLRHNIYNKVSKSETEEIVIYITPRLRKHLRTGERL